MHQLQVSAYKPFPLACQRRLGSMELQLMAWEMLCPCHRKGMWFRWGCRVTPRAQGLQQHQQPRQNPTRHEQQGNSAWVEMNSANYIISVATLFKASKSSSKQEDWKGWNAKFLWEGICNLSDSAVISAWTVHAKFCFLNTWIIVFEVSGGRAVWTFCSALWSTQNRAGSGYCSSVFLLFCLKQGY